MLIRRATAADLDHIAMLWRESWQVHEKMDARFQATPFAETVMKDWIESHLDDDRARVLVAELNDAFAGFLHAVLLENPPVIPNQLFGYISDLAVTSSARRKGVGALLVDEAHRWFRQKQVAYVEINVSVRNAIARQFWRRVGYQDWLERLRFEL